MKRCRDCLQDKPLEGFYKHSKMGDGHLNKCIECVKERVEKHRLKNLEKVRAYDRSRVNRWAPGYLKKYRTENPEIYKAHNILNSAVRDGRIEKPAYCCECGERKKVVGHHPDYSKPLEVMWMCQGCHKQWHAKNDV